MKNSFWSISRIFSTVFLNSIQFVGNPGQLFSILNYGLEPDIPKKFKYFVASGATAFSLLWINRNRRQTFFLHREADGSFNKGLIQT